MKSKICTKCSEDKNFEEYFKNKNAKLGIMSACKDCCNLAGAKYRAENAESLKERRKLNSKANSERTKKWYSSNKEKALDYQKKYRSGKEEYFKTYGKNYYEENKEALKEKRSTPEKKAKASERARIWKENQKKKEEGK